MMGLLRLAVVAAFLATAALLNAGQTSVTTWSNAPDPTGIMEGDPLAMMGDIGNWWTRELQDFDTRTVATLASGSCTTSESLILDKGYEKSFWLLFDKGRGGAAIEYTGLAFEHSPLSSWVWNTEGDGDYGSSAPATAIFWFNDGRAESDPRHDFKRLGGHTVTKLIPDLMTTTYEGCALGPGYVSYHRYSHTIKNQTYPEFGFDGLELDEEIFWVECSNGDCPQNLQRDLNAQATGTWTVTGNDLGKCDKHGVGGRLFEALQQHDSVLVFQRYRILNDNWVGKNLEHGVGKMKGGLEAVFSGFHLIRYELDGSCMIVEKNGVGAGDCSTSCADIPTACTNP